MPATGAVPDQASMRAPGITAAASNIAVGSAVITLRYQLDCSHEDMSVVLDIPVKTVKSRLFEARKQLRARMVEAGETNFFVTRG